MLTYLKCNVSIRNKKKKILLGGGDGIFQSANSTVSSAYLRLLIIGPLEILRTPVFIENSGDKSCLWRTVTLWFVWMSLSSKPASLKISIRFRCRTLSKAFLKLVKHANTSQLTSRAFWISTWMLHIASGVLRPFLKPNCVSEIFCYNFL